MDRQGIEKNIGGYTKNRQILKTGLKEILGVNLDWQSDRRRYRGE